MFKKHILTAIALAALSTAVQAFDLYSATDSNTTAATTETAPKKVNASPQQEKHSSNRQEPRKERRIMERKERERRAIERRERERRAMGHKNRGHQERQQGPMENRENHEQQPKNSNPNKLNQGQPSMDHNNPFVPTPASKTAPPPE